MKKLNFIHSHRIVTVFVLFLTLTVCSQAAAPTWGWVTNVAGDGASGLAVDHHGYIYWSGHIRAGSINGTQPLTGIFLSKLYSTGDFVWAKVGESSPGPTQTHLDVDSAGDILLSGVSNGSINVFGSSAYGPFIAKLGSSGVLGWSRTIYPSVPGYNSTLEASWDSQGNIIGSGGLPRTVSVDGFAVTPVGSDLLMLGLNGTGTARWLKRGGPASASNIAVGTNGDTYVMGSASNPSFGAITVSMGQGGFITKYGSDGVVKWVRGAPAPSGGYIQFAVMRPDGKLAVVGMFYEKMTIGSFTFTVPANSYNGQTGAALLAILDPETGAVLSAKLLIPTPVLSFGSVLVTCDNKGTLRIAGTYASNFSFDGIPVTLTDNNDLFVAAVDPSNSTLWVKTARFPNASTLTGLANDSAGHTYVSGSFQATALFDDQLIEANGNRTFLAQLNEGPSAIPIITNAPTAQSIFTGNAVTFVAGVSSTTTVQYQWFFNDVAISGQTNSTLTLNSVSPLDAGFYFVEVSNADGTVRSTPVELVIRGDAPVRLITLAGTNIAGYKNAPGIEARLNMPNSPAITFDGNLIVPENGNNLIRIVEPDGFVGTYAGSTNAGLVNGSAADARFNAPLAVAIHPSGDIFVADTYNFVIRRISAFGARRVTTFAGSGLAGAQNGNGTNAQFNFPNDLVFDSNGNLFVCEFHNHTIRKIDANANVTTFAGSGTAGSKDGTGTGATFNQPAGIAVDSNNNLFVTEWTGQRIRKITPAGVVTTLAGSDNAGFVDGPQSSALLNTPDGIALDPAGNIYFTEVGNHSVRRLDTAGNVTTLAGLGHAGFRDGDRTTALLNIPGGIAWYPNGSLIIADTGNHAIRRLDFLTNTPPASATLVVNLHPGLTIFGTVGKTYRIEAAESSLGTLDWVTVGTLTLAHPVELWFDSEPASRAQRFYRAVEVP